jgi:hypothetical protein
MSIALLTFDIFGTVVDWRRGLGLSGEAFDRVVDRQGELESEAFRPYAAIVAQSLVDELDMEPEEAARIGAQAGGWPLYADSAESLRSLRGLAPCAAITNSDRAHGAQVQAQLGFPLEGVDLCGGCSHLQARPGNVARRLARAGRAVLAQLVARLGPCRLRPRNRGRAGAHLRVRAAPAFETRIRGPGGAGPRPPRRVSVAEVAERRVVPREESETCDPS